METFLDSHWSPAPFQRHSHCARVARTSGELPTHSLSLALQSLELGFLVYLFRAQQRKW